MSNDGPTTATILFTDAVGSTAMRAEIGEERADLLRREHDGLLEATITAHRGRVVKGVGDGLMAAFTSATDALAAAVAIQQELHRFNSRPGQPALLARVGISIGDVAWENDDCFGTPVIEAARIEAQASGGQILCSEFVRVMARGRGGHQFVDLGEMALKGLPEPVRVFEVGWAPAEATSGVRVPFPPELAVDRGTPFVGRDEEAKVAGSLVADPQRDRPVVLWILGEPGIGKTRLAAEIAAAGFANGATVLFGRCDEDFRVPYQPFIEALQTYSRYVPDDRLATVLGPGAWELTRLVPALASRLPAPSGVAPQADTTSFAMFQSVRGWLEAASAERPLIVVLDDLHGAAAETLSMLHHCAGASVGGRIAFLCTARNTEQGQGLGLPRLIDDIRRRGAVQALVELDGLSPEAVADLISKTTGQPLDAALRRTSSLVHGESAGNPLFVTALARTLNEGGAMVGGDLVAAVQRRLGALADDVREALGVAALIGNEFDIRVLSRVLERDELATLDALELAAKARVVSAMDANRFRWSHALVRGVLREEISPARRTRLHARIGAAIEQVAGRLDDSSLAAIAHHAWEARGVAGNDRAFQFSVAAADAAMAVYAYDDAVTLYSRAMEIAETAGAERLHVLEIRAHLGDALVHSVKYDEGMEHLSIVVEEGVPMGAIRVAAEAAVSYEQANWGQGTEGDEAVRLLRTVLPLLDGRDPLRVLVLASLGRAMARGGERPRALEVAEEAVALARTHPEEWLLAEALGHQMVHQWILSGGDIAHIERYFREFSEVAHASRQAHTWFNAMLGRCWLAYHEGTLDDLKAASNQISQHARERHELFWESIGVMQAIGIASAEGRLDDADALAEEMYEIGQAFRGLDISGAYGFAKFRIRREQDRLQEIEPQFRMLLRLAGPNAIWRVGLLCLLAELDDREAASRLLKEILQDDIAAVARDDLWVTNLLLLCEACALVGDSEDAAALLVPASEWREMVILAPGSSYPFGPFAHFIGLLHTVTRRWDEAERYFAEAREANVRLGAPLLIANTDYEWARMLYRRGTPEAAVHLVAEGTRLAEEYNLGRLKRRFRELTANAPL